MKKLFFMPLFFVFLLSVLFLLSLSCDNKSRNENSACPSNAYDNEGNCMEVCEGDENCKEGYKCDESTGNCVPENGDENDFPGNGDNGENDGDDYESGDDISDGMSDEENYDDDYAGVDSENTDGDIIDSEECPEKRDCGDICCEEGEMCYNSSCVADCSDPGQLCGADFELCCASDEVCFGGEKCVKAGDECTYTEECEIDEYCEPLLKRCIPREEGEVCEYRPPVGEFSPEAACFWIAPPGEWEDYSDVVMAPVVGNLTDDNEDGVTDTDDTPDIVFISFDYNAHGCCTQYGVLRIVDGRCNPDGTMNTIATIDDVWMDNSGGLVLANLDPPEDVSERNPEIVAVFKSGGTIAWKRVADDGSEWEEMWHNDEYLTSSQTRGGTQPSVADLTGDGLPEVVVGNVVLSGQTGELIWDGNVTSSEAGISGGVGNNAFLGPASVVADIDRDDTMEVIAGNTVYNGKTGEVKAHYEYASSNSSCGGALPCDGLPAIGNFDSDFNAEIVIVRRGEVFIMEDNMTPKHIFQIPVDDCSNNEGGPPTVADFTGDGKPEIGVAGADYYVVFDTDCAVEPLPDKCEEKNILWKVPNNDCSSRVTASSVFDFEGDGKAEVVYADQTNFRIFDGTTGKILFDDEEHISNTRMEMPVIADVDNDRQAEVLVPRASGDISRGGLGVWKDSENNWVRTRRIWNQHSYHITNITEDGQVPSPEEHNWLQSRLNNFRQNVQPDGIFDASDLFVKDIEFDECIYPDSETAVAKFKVEISNKGMIGVGPGVPVLIMLYEVDTEVEHTAVLFTETSILPGNSEIIPHELELEGSGEVFSLEVTADMDDEGKQKYNECDETNNYLEKKGMSCKGDS